MDSSSDPYPHLALLTAGLEQLSAGRFEAATATFDELAAREPRNPSHWANLGTALRGLQQFDDALLAYANAAALGAASPDFHYSVGLLHQDRGDYEHALKLLRQATDEAPRDAEFKLQYAQCCYEMLHIEDALAALQDWEQLESLDAQRIASIALLLLNLGETAASQAAIRRLLLDANPSPEALLRVAQIMERNNRIEEARSALATLQGDDRARGLGDELQQLEAQLAQRQRQHEPAATLFRGLAERCTEPHRRHLHLFPLAKSLDALGRYEEAYQTLVAAHKSQLAHLHRTRPDVVNLDEPPMLITRYGCDSADVARWSDDAAPDAQDSPVFVVAFPRSGTTLLEQALDAHPQLVTMDEQPFLQRAIDHLVERGIAYPERLADLSSTQLSEARALYWSLTRRKVTLASGQRLIDKNPLNLLRLPAIRRLFPAANILLAIRHPADVVLSCFMQHFRAPEFALMCRDLPTLAHGYRRAFDFWYAQQALLAPRCLELRYEDLVADFEPGMRTVAQFLDLPWNDAMLKPAERARSRGFISTPSYSQVIEPVHRRSVDRWRHYAVPLEATRPQLAPYFARWGYEF